MSLTPDDIPAITQLLAEGKTQNQVADLFGCHQIAVSAFVREHQIPHRTRARRVDHAAVLRCRAEGLSVKETAARLGVNPDTVKSVWHRAVQRGEVRSLARKVTEADRDRFRARFDAGVPVAEIAKETGWRKETVYVHLHKMGYRTNGLSGYRHEWLRPREPKTPLETAIEALRTALDALRAMAGSITQ